MDAIAMDTNVFGHLTHYSGINKNQHINKLLKYLIKSQISLLVDKDNKILNEYKHHLNKPTFKRKYDKREESYFLQYFMDPARHKPVFVNETDDLWNAIIAIVDDPNEVDQRLVYVAFCKGKLLLSNDNEDIVSQRSLLFEKTKGKREKGSDIMNSQQAFNTILSND
ncbi:MAG: hypothetical protein OXF20_15475 [Gammaproteobacteria bacterium]|nr:hypothetical protein [Gammaproteobacteria bacterium]